MIYQKNPEDYQDNQTTDKTNQKETKKDSLAYHKTMNII